MQLGAVKEQRALLADTDHVAPCLTKLVGALRGELTDRHRELEQAVAGATGALARDATWSKLDGVVQTAILRREAWNGPRRCRWKRTTR